MRKYFFRPFIADPVCASSDPGHHVDVGRYFMAVVKSSVAIPVQAVVHDGFVRLDWDGQSTDLWNHRPDDVDDALRGTHGVAEWAPEWQVLLVPRASLADERTTFTLAYPEEHTECVADEAFSLAAPRWIRRN
jgi:carbohydrate-binding DOMON domain-containing protein